MGEVMKQARIDNWAMFVMSRLQIFFNKTDYCDLTLQFDGNVQLKVHRVIMNACTDYFLLLEQECDMQGDDVLVMPPDLQPDVILPIVNFMYTGILEYEQSIYEQLYSTAELMNISVLLKFLDAQKVKTKTLNRQQSPAVQKKVVKPNLPAPLPGRKLPVWKRKIAPVPVQINPVKPYSPETRTSLSASDPLRFDNTPKPTRFEWPDEDIKDIKPFDQMPMDSGAFDGISYSSKPLMTQEEELRSTFNSTVFDDLRQLPTSKPVKLTNKDKDYNPNSSVDMEDLKSYVKEQKIRSNLADYADEEDPDDPDYVPGNSKRKTTSSPTTSSKKPRISNEKENLVELRTSPSSKMDHSKIISEVLKKYPQLVQKNKNIRLKILQKNKADDKDAKPASKPMVVPSVQITKKFGKLNQQAKSQLSPSDKPPNRKNRIEDQTWECTICTSNGEPIEFVLYYLYRKHMTDVHQKQFDARDCKHCGALYEQPLQMAYHMYMCHAVLPPRNVVFPKCTKCAYTALDRTIMQRHLAFHAANVHHSQCPNCKLGYSTEHHLKIHMQLAGHNGKNHLSFDCQYCTRQLNSASSLFVHCKTTHLDDAIKDGMLSLDDDHIQPSERSPGKLVSNQKVTTSEEVESSSNITSALGPFDIVVLDNQQQYILQQDEPTSQTQTIETQEGFMTLPELQGESYNINQSDIGSTDELVMVLTDHDYNDGNSDTIINNENSNIVVLYSHPVEGQTSPFISQGNIMLNSETGLLEIHNDGMNISGQSESIEMIQKEIQSHESSTDSQKMVTSSIDTETVVPNEPEKEKETDGKVTTSSSSLQLETFPNTSNESLGFTTTEENAEGTTPETNVSTSSPQPSVPTDTVSLPEVETIKGKSDDQDLEKKVLSVEANATKELLTTVEEVVPSTDSTDFAEDVSNDQSFGETTHEGDLHQSEPEPMEIDEELKQNSESKILTRVEETSEILQDIEKPSSTENINENAPSTNSSTEPTEDKSLETATSENPPVQEQITESQDLFESQSEEKLEEIVESSINDIPQHLLEPISQDIDTEVELISQSTTSQYDEYKTSASLSVSEQCPEEPMEVDGSVKVQKEQPEEQVLPAALGETDSQEIVAPVPSIVDEVSQEDSAMEENDNNTEQESNNTQIEDNVDEVDSTQQQNDNEKNQEDKDVQEVQKKELVKDKPEISTLLNDWEDTDSQQSDTGKGTAVNKLINDWDDD